MAGRRTFTGCLDQIVFCDECGDRSEPVYSNPKNGIAWAAQHHDRTGHVVTVEIYNVVRYGARPDDKPPRGS